MLTEAHVSTTLALDECDALRAHMLVAPPSDSGALFLALESVLLAAVRAYESMVEDAFLAYMCGEAGLDGTQFQCRVGATDHAHARRLLGARSRDDYLSWERPAIVIDLAEAFLHADHPMRVALTSRQDIVLSAKRVRNRVAHAGSTSLGQYRTAVAGILLVAPDPLPRPGEFLSMRPRRGAFAGREVLASYLEVLKSSCNEVAQAPRP